MAFQTLNINGRIRMNSRVMNENGREGWTMETYIDKNQEKGNHYNYSRSSKNFELTKGGNFAFLNDNRHIPIEQRLNARLAELNFHYYKEDSKNAPYSCVDIIVGGDHDRMCELAKNYGNITSWARDNYNFFADKFGEDNIISFCVHMDETTPHAHVLIVPTALRKQRGRVKSGEQRKAKEVISFKAHFGDLSKANSRKAAYQKWHDDYYQAVGKKWGFERGRDLDSMTAEERAEHTHLHKTELDKRNELRAENKYLQERKKKLNDEVQEQEKKVADSKQKLQDLESTVANKERRVNDLDTSLFKKRMEFATLTSDIATKKTEKEDLEKEISDKKQKLEDIHVPTDEDIINARKKYYNQFHLSEGVQGEVTLSSKGNTCIFAKIGDDYTKGVRLTDEQLEDYHNGIATADQLAAMLISNKIVDFKLQEKQEELDKLEAKNKEAQKKSETIANNIQTMKKAVDACNNANLQWQNNGIIGMLKKLVDLIGQICGPQHNFHDLANDEEATLFYNAIYDPDRGKRLQNFEDIWEIAKINQHQGWTDTAHQHLYSFAARDLFAEQQEQEEEQHDRGLKR